MLRKIVGYRHIKIHSRDGIIAISPSAHGWLGFYASPELNPDLTNGPQRHVKNYARSRDLILRVALWLAGDPDQDLMTYEKHNGFQLINMLCQSSIARRAESHISNAGEVSDMTGSSFDMSLASAIPPSTEETRSTSQSALFRAATEPATFAWADVEEDILINRHRKPNAKKVAAKIVCKANLGPIPPKIRNTMMAALPLGL
nr:uncharacterized protein I203_05818 [Kwoniella mangroviensis CBS 8507]OCF65076.1 hypothetical protein I203_05818 [Kwoniella mangroviensis CBS 8507]